MPAVTLFLQRAQAIRSDFHLTTDNAATIAHICLRLEGLPLAIELAAARIKLFSPQALLARLDRRLQVLTGGARDLPLRQQTLRKTLAWSYELLKPEEQCLFQRISVFVGGATLAAIEAVCQALGDETGRVFERLASLLDKSLIQQQTQRDEEPRFVMLETVREYGLEALASGSAAQTTHQAHAAYYLALAEQAEPERTGPQQVVWLERLELEHDNLRAAMQWLLEQGGTEQRSEMALRLGGALMWFWQVRTHWSEGRTFLERALAGNKGVAVPVQVKALQAAAYLAYLQGDTARAEALLEESLALSRKIGDTAGIALSLRRLGLIAGWRSNLEVAASRTEEALALFRAVRDKEGIAGSLSNLADIVGQQGEYARAISLYEESLAFFRAIGNKKDIAFSLFHLADALFLSQGDPAKVRTLLEESLALRREVGHKTGIAWALALFGEVVLQQGDTVKARLLLEESLALCREIGHKHSTAESSPLFGRVEVNKQAGVVARFMVAKSLSLLGRVEAHDGNYAAARDLYEEALTLAMEEGDTLNIHSYLEGLADVVAVQGNPAWAALLWGAAEALREAMGTPIPPVYRTDYDRSVVAARAQLGEQAFAAAWSEGRTMSLEQVLIAHEPVQLAPHRTTEPGKTRNVSFPQSPAGLTTREVDVLRLLAQGLTSAQIAEHLVLSPLTVNTHVRSIYSKLGVTSRSAATRYAIEHHLL